MTKIKIVSNTIITCLLMLGLFNFINLRIYISTDRERVVKVGFVYESDESTPYTYNYVRAQKALEDAYPDNVEVLVESNISEEGCGDAIDRLINEGCELIFTTSYGFQFAAKERAASNPEIQFCQATGDNVNEAPVTDNYHTFMGEIYQGRYLTGIVAGMKLKQMIDKGEISPEEAKVGFVAAYSMPEVVSGYTSFFLGIKEEVPEATMKVKYINSWSNFSAEKTTARELIDEGCLIIGQHTDTIGPAMACEEYLGDKPVYHVGYNQSAIGVAPTTSLVSTRINWIPYVIGATECVITGKDIEQGMKGCHIHGNDCSAGISRDWIQMLDLNTHIAAPDTVQTLTEKTAILSNDRFTVFKGPYTGVNPDDPSDIIDLSEGYIENERRSAPSFYYILDGIVTE